VAFGDSATLRDDFNAGFENPIVTNWTVPVTPGDGNGIMESGQFRGATSARCSAYWDAGTPGQNLDAYGTFVNIAFGRSSYIYARLQSEGTSGVDGYAVRVSGEGDGNHVRLYRIDNGTENQIADSGVVTCVNGDKVGIRCILNTIEGYLFHSGAWSLVATATDSTYSSAGKVGMGCAGSSELVGWDDFYWGDLPIVVGFISPTTSLFGPMVVPGRPIFAPLIAASTSVYVPSVPNTAPMPFIAATTVLYTPTVRRKNITVPFISSTTKLLQPFIARPLTNVVPPSISGTPTQGQQLEASPGVWSGTLPIFYSYQWRRCNAGGGACVDISGETGYTYIVRAADVGNTLRIRVTASN
jgi:hypothetical protein